MEDQSTTLKDIGSPHTAIDRTTAIIGVGNIGRAYPWLVDESVRIVIVGHSKRMLPTSKPNTSRFVQRVLEREGIKILTATAIIRNSRHRNRHAFNKETTGTCETRATR